MLAHNPVATRTSYPDHLKQILNLESAIQAREWLVRWPMLNARATPMRALPDLANRLGLSRLMIKDEACRSFLGSFKALGAPFALMRLASRVIPNLDPGLLMNGGYARELEALTVITATDGNHGRALAAAAQSMGCPCVIVLHANVSVEREKAITAYGAQIVRIKGNYDDSVDEAARLAALNGWQVVSDTSYEGYETIPGDVMQGYGAIAAEIVEQTGHTEKSPFSHVFLQGGVGGLAAGVAAFLWEYYGENRPRFIMVEPEQADCLYQSALAGKPVSASGVVDSVMAGLACGKVSPLAWRILEQCIDDFLIIDDGEAVQAMKTLAQGGARDMPMVSGESGAAGLAGLNVLLQTPEFAEAVELDAHAKVLLINTEGATAPSVYESLVGESAAVVCQRQLAWLAACQKN